MSVSVLVTTGDNDMFRWDIDTAVERVKDALDDIGGIEYLYKNEAPSAYVIADNWSEDCEISTPGNPVSSMTRARIAKDAKRYPVAWDAMVLIIAQSIEGHYKTAERIVIDCIGKRPGESKGRSRNIRRNEFIYEWIEILRDAGGMKLKDAYRVMSRSLNIDTETVRNGLRQYLKYIEERSEKCFDVIGWKLYWIEYGCIESGLSLRDYLYTTFPPGIVSAGE